MQEYNTLFKEFIQYKRFLGYKYKTDEIVLNEIIQYLIKNNISMITKEVTSNYATVNTNLSSNTIARNMGVFREFCYYLKTQKNINCYQIPTKIYPQNHNSYIPYLFTHEEIKLIFSNLNNALNNYHYNYYKKTIYPLIIKILYQTGMRIGEILNLRIKDYNNNLSVFKLVDTKNNEERYVAIPEKLNKEIYDYCTKFFYNKSNEEIIFKVSKSSVLKYFKKVLNISNITITDSGPRLHDLRHAFVIHNINKAIKENKDINMIIPILQAQLGHKSLEALSYYFHINKDVLYSVNNVSEEKLSYLIPKDGVNNEQ